MRSSACWPEQRARPRPGLDVLFVRETPEYKICTCAIPASMVPSSRSVINVVQVVLAFLKNDKLRLDFLLISRTSASVATGCKKGRQTTNLGNRYHALVCISQFGWRKDNCVILILIK